ncbi:hypothetical protein [Pilimelia columellifera]|uniref:XRE family transcriptional regulator n=1 Tax=Pilimelia columellifera subsp. columellifera TaxID=706583 RepID=A0ABN3MZA3_9ACTN
MEPHVSSALRHGPFHHALRAAIKARGLPLERLRQCLAEADIAVGVATLSSWQSGRRRPERPDSLRAVEILEEILDLPERSLIVLLGAPRRRGPAPRREHGARGYAELLDAADRLARLVQQLGCRDGRLRVLSAHDIAYIGADSSLASLETTVVMEAVEETDRYVAFYQGGSGIDPTGGGSVEFIPTGNCRVGRTRHDPANGLFVAEMLLDRRLRPGDTSVTRYRVTDRTGAGGGEYVRFLRFSAQQVVIEARFSADALPLRCWSFTRAKEGHPDQTHEEVTLGAYHEAHVVGADLSAGLIGIGWDAV